MVDLRGRTRWTNDLTLLRSAQSLVLYALSIMSDPSSIVLNTTLEIANINIIMADCAPHKRGLNPFFPQKGGTI